MAAPPPNKYRRTYRSLGGWAVAAIAVLLLSASGSWAQAPAPSPSDEKVDTKVDAKLDAKLDTELEDGASQQAGTASPPPSQAEPQAGHGKCREEAGRSFRRPGPLKLPRTGRPADQPHNGGCSQLWGCERQYAVAAPFNQGASSGSRRRIASIIQHSFGRELSPGKSLP